MDEAGEKRTVQKQSIILRYVHDTDGAPRFFRRRSLATAHLYLASASFSRQSSNTPPIPPSTPHTLAPLSKPQSQTPPSRPPSRSETKEAPGAGDGKVGAVWTESGQKQWKKEFLSETS